MKKTSIISILIVFLVSIILVGFFGRRMRTEEIIEVTSIYWNTTDLETDGYTVKKYTPEEKKKQNLSYDGLLEAPIDNTIDVLTLHIICEGQPIEADNRKLQYYFEDTPGVSMKKVGENEADITFTKPAEINLNVKSTDGLNIVYVIKINVYDPDDFEWM